MATIKGLWFLNDSLITWEGLPVGYTNTININGRVWKNGVWQPFVSLRVTEHSKYSYLFKNDMVFTSGDGEYINIIDNGYKWWTGFTRDRVIDFGEEPQEMDDTIYNFITTNATQVEFNDVFMILNGNFKWKEVLQDGTNFNHDYIYVNGNFTEPEGEIFECFMFAIVTEELASALGLTSGVWGLGRGIMNTNTEEQTVTGFYQNGVWSSEEARSFTLNNQTLSKSLATYILNNTEPRVSKGPNYVALKNALDRLATAIKNNIGGEAVYPFTIEEMCNIADGTMPAANEGEKGKEGFFYYMGKMADCIAQRCDVELPLTIEEMIENVKSIVIEEETNYLTFSSPSTFTLNIVDNIQYWDGILEYSTDTTSWNTWDGTTTLNSSADGKLYMRGTSNTKITNTNASDKGCWILTGNNISCKGNIENLLDYKTVENGQHPTMDRECYSYMFYGCTSLIEAPELSAVDLTINCYSHMFYGCSSLVEPSKLYPNIIAAGCFYGMYFGCSNIKGMIDLTKITDFTSSSIIADFSSNYFPIIRLGTNLKTITNNIFTLTLEVPNISLRFEFTDSDTPQFDTTNYLAKGTNKTTRSYKIYTDNTTIKDGALSQANSYTTVNVYHLDGSDWGTA